MNPAICCGNRIIPTTTTSAIQSNTSPTIQPLIAHCCARRCCQNPKPRSTMDNPRNQGRNFRRKALAPAAPMAAAKAIGKQQAMVAMELTIAPTEAEMPVPCFMNFLSPALHAQRAESFPQVERLPLCIPDTTDRTLQNCSSLSILPRHHAH